LPNYFCPAPTRKYIYIALDELHCLTTFAFFDPFTNTSKASEPVDDTVNKEKGPQLREIAIGQSGGSSGDLQVHKLSDSDNLKLAKDGITVLIPQPSDDPDDPVSMGRHRPRSRY